MRHITDTEWQLMDDADKALDAAVAQTCAPNEKVAEDIESEIRLRYATIAEPPPNAYDVPFLLFQLDRERKALQALSLEHEAIRFLIPANDADFNKDRSVRGLVKTLRANFDSRGERIKEYLERAQRAESQLADLNSRYRTLDQKGELVEIDPTDEYYILHPERDNRAFKEMRNSAK